MSDTSSSGSVSDSLEYPVFTIISHWKLDDMRALLESYAESGDAIGLINIVYTRYGKETDKAYAVFDKAIYDRLVEAGYGDNNEEFWVEPFEIDNEMYPSGDESWDIFIPLDKKRARSEIKQIIVSKLEELSNFFIVPARSKTNKKNKDAGWTVDVPGDGETNRGMAIISFPSLKSRQDYDQIILAKVLLNDTPWGYSDGSNDYISTRWNIPRTSNTGNISRGGARDNNAGNTSKAQTTARHSYKGSAKASSFGKTKVSVPSTSSSTSSSSSSSPSTSSSPSNSKAVTEGTGKQLVAASEQLPPENPWSNVPETVRSASQVRPIAPQVSGSTVAPGFTYPHHQPRTATIHPAQQFSQMSAQLPQVVYYSTVSTPQPAANVQHYVQVSPNVQLQQKQQPYPAQPVVHQDDDDDFAGPILRMSISAYLQQAHS